MKISRVLVVDDSKVVQFKLRRMLEAHGLGVDTAGSGNEALNYLKGNLPDAIFMDFMMPDMDGYQATAMIKSNPTTSAVPVIMCTGQDTPEGRVRARESGASGFVTKPIDDATLSTVLTELGGKTVSAIPMPTAAVPHEAFVDAAHAHAAAPSMSDDELLRTIERIAHEVADKVVAEAIAAYRSTSAEPEEVARTAALHAAEEALAHWRAESATAAEELERRAIGAAERVAEGIARHSADESASPHPAFAEFPEDKVREVLASAEATAERVARQTMELHSASVAQAQPHAPALTADEIDERVHKAAEAAARPAAETAAREIAEGIVTTAIASARSDDAEHRSRIEEETVATAERVARETLEAHKAAIESTSRDALESMRAELHETMKSLAESAAKPVAESAARTVAEQWLNEGQKGLHGAAEAQLHEVEAHAIAAAQEAARAIARDAVSEENAARLASIPDREEKLREALTTIEAAAERIAQEAVASHKASLDDGARHLLESAHAELQGKAREAAHDAAKPIAESAARAVAEETLRTAFAARAEGEASLRAEVERSAVAAAEQAAHGIVQQSARELEGVRRAMEASTDEKLREALANAEATAARAAQEALASGRAAIEEGSRQILDAAREELHERVKLAAEAVAKPVADASAREVAGEVVKSALAADHAAAAARRNEVKERAIAAAERVARELVQHAFEEAAETDAAVAADVERGVRPAPALVDSSAVQATEVPVASVPSPPPSAARSALMPWLALLTLAVLYLLYKSFI